MNHLFCCSLVTYTHPKATICRFMRSFWVWMVVFLIVIVVVYDLVVVDVIVLLFVCSYGCCYCCSCISIGNNSSFCPSWPRTRKTKRRKMLRAGKKGTCSLLSTSCLQGACYMPQEFLRPLSIFLHPRFRNFSFLNFSPRPPFVQPRLISGRETVWVPSSKMDAAIPG